MNDQKMTRKAVGPRHFSWNSDPSADRQHEAETLGAALSGRPQSSHRAVIFSIPPPHQSAIPDSGQSARESGQAMHPQPKANPDGPGTFSSEVDANVLPQFVS